MKCINNIHNFIVKSIISLSVLTGTVLLCGCGNTSYVLPYDPDSAVNAFAFEATNSESVAVPFAADLCVAPTDVALSSANMTQSASAGLFDITHHNTIYAKNVNNSVHPASLTKIMTAYLALKYGKTDDILTASENVLISESGAQLCGFKPGDQLTLDQVLHGLLIYSGNDAAVMIAEYVSGSVEEFSNLMNEEALSLGATNTHFNNPHGLTDDNHYTTVYDLYLIFQAAMQYDKFREIIHTSKYNTTYTDRDGNSKDISFATTNGYLNGLRAAPGSVSVIGGKTGTTKAAGNCLILLSNNSAGESYISCVMKTEDKEKLYDQMSTLMKLIP